MRRMRLTLLTALALLAALAAAAVAQDYPTKPVRLIIPFPPGGSNDMVGRMVATQLGERLGKQVVVDNRGGAGGVIGTEIAAKSPPDGYTLLVISLAYAVNPSLYKLPYDPVKAFVPVAHARRRRRTCSSVHPSCRSSSVKELIALAKQKPGELNYASAGVGSFQHLGARALQADGRRRHRARAVQGRRAGDDRRDRRPQPDAVRLARADVPTSAPASSRRWASAAQARPALPDVPTIAEAGVPGYEATNWWGIVAPAGTPQAIVDGSPRRSPPSLSSPETQKRFAAEGAEACRRRRWSSGRSSKSEIGKWQRVVKEAKIRAE